MIISAKRAVRLLKAADPWPQANSIPMYNSVMRRISGVIESATHDDRFSHEMTCATPDFGRRSRVRGMVAGLAAILVTISIAVGTLLLSASDRPSPVSTGSDGAAPARKLLASLSRNISSFPHQEGLAYSPSPLLANSILTSSMPSDSAIAEHRWWGAPGSVTAAQQYFRTHVPKGTAYSSDRRMVAPAARVTSMVFAASSLPSGVDSGTIALSFVPLTRGRIAARIDILVTWHQPRHDFVGSILGGEGTLDTEGSHPVSFHLSAHAAKTIAGYVERLPAPPPRLTQCPNYRGHTDGIQIYTTRGTVTVSVLTGECGPVSVTSAGSTHSYAGGYSLDEHIRDVVGHN